MSDVFISYHEKSAGKLVAQIADALESAGISCWYAKRDISGGGDFARDIPPQIDACKLFLLVLNENVYQSKHIENEVGLAFSRLNHGENITILPIEIENFERKSWIKYYLIHIQSVKMPDLKAERIQGLVQQAAKLLHHKTQHAPLMIPPPVKIIKSGDCGDNITFTLDENGVLTISGVGPMHDFEWDNDMNIIKTPWWDERKFIAHIVIQDGVICIGKNAFSGCSRLASVRIPNGVTRIGVGAFCDCARLTSITIPNGVTEIEGGAFSACRSLKSITIPNGVTSIGVNAFGNCERLTSVIIPNSVTYIGPFAFASCERLKSVTIPSSVTKIEVRTFSDCKELTSVTIPDSVAEIDWGAFSGCIRLRTVSIPAHTKIRANMFSSKRAFSFGTFVTRRK